MYAAFGPLARECVFPDLALLHSEADARWWGPHHSRVPSRLERYSSWIVMCWGTPVIDNRAVSLHDIVTFLDHDRLSTLAKLNGSFAVLAYDRPNRRVFVVTDRSASRRVFVRALGDSFLVFPRTRYFKQLGATLLLDDQRVLEFMTFRALILGRTFLNGVQRVPPAAVLTWGPGKNAHLRRYWSWSFDDARDEPENASTTVDDALRMAVRSAAGERDVWLLLSGGLDSRMLLGYLLENRPPDSITAVNHGTPGTLDYEIGRIVAEHAGVRFVQIDVSTRVDHDYGRVLEVECYETDGTVDLVHAPNQAYLTLGDTSRVLTGALGDKLTGKPVRLELLDLEIASAADRRRARLALTREMGIGVARFLPSLLGLHHQVYEDAVNDLLLRIEPPDTRLPGYVSAFDCGVINPYFELPCIMKGDEIVDYHNPFSDLAVVDAWSHVPDCQRAEQRLYKHLLRTRFPKLASLPTKGLEGRDLFGKTHSLLETRLGPDPFVKHIRYGSLLRRPSSSVRHVVRELLDGLLDRNIVQPEVVESLWAQHDRGERDNYFVLLRLASLERIARCYG